MLDFTHNSTSTKVCTCCCRWTRLVGTNICNCLCSPTAKSRQQTAGKKKNEGGPDIINIIRKTRMDIKTFPASSEQPKSSPAGFLPNSFDPSWCILYEQLAAQTTAAANQLSCVFVYSFLSFLLFLHLVFSCYAHSVQTTN